MAFRTQHAGQHLHDGIQGMHHAVKFFAIRFRGFQGVRDLRDMRGFHGFHFPRGLVDRIVRDLERLLRRFQSGNFDRAVFHVNTVQINIFSDFHQLRQRLRRNILHGGHRGAYGGNVIAHIRHDRRHLPQRRRGLLVGLAYVIGERGCLLLKLGRVRFGDGLLQALSTRHRLLQLVFHVQRRPYECAGENGEGGDYHKYANQDLATATFALDLANMLGAHTAPHAAGMRGAGSGIFWTGGCGCVSG